MLTKIIYGVLAVFGVIILFKLKKWLTNRAYQKGEENRKKRHKK